MKKLIAAAMLLVLVSAGACRTGSARRGPTGKPVPAFLGDIPQDAFADDCEPGNYGGTLVMAVPASPTSFNPITATDPSTVRAIEGPIYKALTDYDNKEQKEVPGLARSWESTPDGLQWTFNLRRGVRWSDGEPFNADDVLFSLQVTFDPNVAAGARALFTQSDESLPSYEKIDDYTIEFNLTEPKPLFTVALGSVYLIPKHKWEAAYQSGDFAHTLSLDTDPSDIVGLGPYRLTSFKADQSLALERNPYFWKIDGRGQRLPYLDRVVFEIVPDAGSVVLKFQNGETDMLYAVSPDAADSLKKDEQRGDFTVYDLGPSFSTSFLVFNQQPGANKDGRPYVDPVKLKWFRNVKFRQAVSFAIDREGIIRTALFGHGVPIYGFDTPANKMWYTDQIPKYPYDPERAKHLLAEIGISDRNGDGIAEDPEGHPVKFSMNTNSNSADRVNMGTFVKENLSRVGIAVDFQPLDSNLVGQKLSTTREFDSVIRGWQVGVPPDPIISKNSLDPGGLQYFAFPKQETPSTPWEMELKRFVDLSDSATDIELRQKYYREAMRIWSENLPEIDLIATEFFVAARNRFGNFKPSALSPYTYWNLEELYMTK
ncbi:MAG TPA: ABC transporter substrate-binding protein [Blastocatellia bacterium]|jgi:peptide/nickel transport system substrate-binding protein|nr:ABC transporter substrate-binding protein [Blastocatellia bacterium]